MDYRYQGVGDATFLLFVVRTQEMAPIKQRAAFVSESGVTFGLVDVPKPGPGQILVKVVTAAQNPTDCQFRFAALPLSFEILQNSLNIRMAYIGKSLRRVLKEGKYGGIVGNDFAGLVEELGPDVPEGMWTIGERVAGLVFGS
jgi:NADPH:quinone reductase-like Zn-dependent oxidoreductase